MTTEPLIRLRDVRKEFGTQIVLAGVSLDVRGGEAIALLGGNGAGKTTVLKIVATVLRPTAGHVRIAGHDAVRDAEAVRGQLGFVGHGAWVYDDLTAAENLRFWIGLRGTAATDADAALAGFGLDALADMPARYLSTGQKRRLALARLTALPAPLWLLDEPTLGLDADATAILARAIATQRQGGGRVVLATHVDLGVPDARRLALAAEQAAP